MTRYALNPATPVLSRPDGVVQVGWDPRRAVLVRPPSGMTTAALAALLRALQSGATLSEAQSVADGVDATAIADLVAALVEAGVVIAVPRPRTRIMMNVANPAEAFSLSFLPNDGVGLARLEFIIGVRVHAPARRRSAFTAEGRCRTCWQARCAARAPE